MTDKLFGEITDGFVVFLWDQEAVAGEERTVVEESQGTLVLEHDWSFGRAVDDSAEGAAPWIALRRHSSHLHLNAAANSSRSNQHTLTL